MTAWKKMVIGTKKIALLLAVFILALFAFSQPVAAGCCVGQTGCTRAFDAGECPTTAPFDPLDRECEEIDDCDIGLCCHTDAAFPHSMYKITCTLGFPTSVFYRLDDFTLNPTSYESQTPTYCIAGVLPQCIYKSCEQANTADCRCGFTNLNVSTSPFCCEADNMIFGSIAACQLSSCAAADYVAISGIVYDQDGLPVGGATVRAGGKQTVTDSTGFYRIPLLPTNSAGTVLVTKDIYSNATAYALGTVDIVIDLHIFIGAPSIAAEDCTVVGDQDNDQFGGGGIIPDDMLDRCDSDCGFVQQTVLPAFYHATEVGFCNDRIDNDCDGTIDMDDADCAVAQTVCGDAVVQFPNSQGVFEQCDVASDIRCPGLCNLSNCMCIYAKGCGNGIIDEPEEDCDGRWDPILRRWSPPTSLQGPCGSACRTPLDAEPCTCPTTNICGDHILMYPPEQCEYQTAAYNEDGLLVDASKVTLAPGLGCTPYNEDTNPIPCSPNCQCLLKPVCGNGILEAGEDCDGSWIEGPRYSVENPFFLGSSNSGYWETFKTNKFGCSMTTCGAVAPTSNPGKKTSVTVSGSLGDVQVSQCTCPTLCDVNPPGPNLTAVTGVKFKAEVAITWTDMCPKNVQRYFVYRCSDMSCLGGKTIISGELTPQTREFKDTSVLPRRSYCYYVEGVYNTTTSSMAKKQSKVLCINTGDEECFTIKEVYGDDATEVCAFEKNNVRATCDDDNRLIPVTPNAEKPFVDCNEVDFNADGEPEEGFCVRPGDGTTNCIPRSVCDRCSDAFGLFSYSLQFGSGVSKDSRNYGKAEGYNLGMDWGTYACYDLFGCYMDYSRISVDRFVSVGLNFTCYDYRSEAACDEDKASLEICGWVNATTGNYHQVGFGVCRPKDIDQEQCERCHDPLNKVFGKCSEDTCWLYGHCYYDRDNRNRGYFSVEYSDYFPDGNTETEYSHLCKHMSEISCEDFDTEQDCVNSSGVYSRDGADAVYDSVKVDVQGNLTYSAFNKFAGTNLQTNFSDDYFNYSKCQWSGKKQIFGDGTSIRVDDYKCMRNADSNPPRVAEHAEEFPPFNESDSNVGLDCPNYPLNSQNLGCQRDFLNPNTSVSYPNKVNAHFSLPALVEDDMYDYVGTEQATTYSCIVPKDYASCYPTGVADKTPLANYITWNNTNASYPSFDPEVGFTTGYYDLYFFSEDFANNLEHAIKRIKLFIDASPPDVQLIFSNQSWELFEDIWRTNLSMTLNIINPQVTMDEVATCSVMFKNEFQQEMYPLLTITDEYNDSWHRDYTYLEDGIYYLHYSCEDDVGNVAEDEIELLIDGDKSVTNPQPRGTLNYRNVNMTVDTAKAANCKYLKSYPEVDAFNSTTFTVGQFNTLLPDTFALTGGVYHRQQLTNLETGYHRFYVKCQFPDEPAEKQIVGSRADQVRFAVDVEAPTTISTANRQPYNEWYNNDITLTLTCQDPVIVDNIGLKWQFGCNRTYYCIGNDCHFFQNYSAPFTLTASSNITFYSIDSGQNKEANHVNVQFLIDKVPPNLTIEILEVDERPAEFVRLDLPYKIKLSSDKPLISPAVSAPLVLFSSQPQKFNREIVMYPTLDPRVWEGLLRLTNTNENRGFEGTGILTVTAADHHNVTGSIMRTFLVDTKPPTPPILKPSLQDPSPAQSEYIKAGYPLKYNNGTYYTNEKNLFMTGYTDELLDMVLAQTADDIPKEFRYTQFNASQAYTDKVLSGVARKIRIAGDLTDHVTNEMFIGFGAMPTQSDPKKIGPRRSYGNYGMFYDITSVQYVPGVLGADQYTELTVYEPLEEPMRELAPNQAIYFYDKAAPSFWFGIALDLEEYKHNLVLLFVYDRAGNIARYPPTPEFFDIFYDPDAPMLKSHYPFAGSTSETTLPIEVRVKELKQGSGIDNSTINLSVVMPSGAEVPMFAELIADTEDDLFKHYTIRVSPQFYEDGDYTVKAYLEDWAGNPIDGNETPLSWTFSVDSRAPPRPVFTLVGGNPGPEIEPNTGQPTRWFTKHNTPDFTLEFEEDDPVTVQDIYFASSPTEGERAVCERDNETNFFTCSFNDPVTVMPGFAWADYGIIVEAFKTLGDGTESDPALYGPYDFTIDHEAPDFAMSFNHRIRDSFNLGINATVTNEGHPLKGSFEVMGSKYPLAMTNMMMVDYGVVGYSFIWPVPALSKTYEGDHDMQITLEDYAGNSASTEDRVYIDLTAPRISNLTLDISRILMIGSQYFTRYANVTISGSFHQDDTDVSGIWVEPGTYNISTAKYEQRTLGSIARDAAGGSRTFSISIQLKGQEGAEVLNNMTIFVSDYAGHVATTSLNIWRDLKAPKAPRFCITPAGVGTCPPFGQ